MAPCLLPKISGVEVTLSVTSVESSEQFWHKIRQIWHICEPCIRNNCRQHRVVKAPDINLNYLPPLFLKQSNETCFAEVLHSFILYFQ